jgi:hypothetical protein
MSADADTDTLLTTRRAAERANCSERWIRKLVKKALVEARGKGNGRRVSLASLEKYLATHRRFPELTPEQFLPTDAESGYGRIMSELMRKLPPLSQTRSAARKLGIPESLLERQIESGAVPSVAIGEHLMVPRFWLVEKLAQAQGLSRNGR